MATTALQKMRKRAERAEAVAIGMGFLLLQLRAKFGAEFSIGTTEQVDQAIVDYRRLRAAKEHREQIAAQKAAQQTQPAQPAQASA